MSARDVNLTDGDLLKPLLVLSLPIVASQLMQVAYNLADTFWVGQLGQAPVSALSYAWPIVFLVISVAGGFSVAGTALVSQNKGAGNHDRVNHVAGQTIAFVVLCSVALSVVGYLAAPTLVGLIGAAPGSTEYTLAVEYVRTILLGVFFMFGFFMFQALLRGWGDTKTPMYLMFFGVVLNVVIDPFLVLGFQDNLLFTVFGLGGLQEQLYAATGFAGFGVQGAAIATVLSRGIGAVVGLAWLFSGRLGITISREDLYLKKETVKKIVTIGAPASIDQSTRALGVTVLTAIVALAGDDAVAAFGIGNRLNSLVFLPAIGLAQGTATIVGQNLGAEKAERAERAVYYASGLIAVVLAGVAVVAFTYAETIVGVFIPGEPNVIAIGAEYLYIVAPSFLFLGIYRVTASAFRGSGNTRTAMVFTILSLWVFRVPPAYVLLAYFDMGAAGVFWATALSNVATAIVAFAWFTRGTWKDSVVEGPGTPGPGPTPDVDGDPEAVDD
ncbi:MATE family efflux transporter [Halobacterium litoreum]|uniref:Multidrug-efflux transporter n=1 Tax=Halobacterium litoreum TaxID=2039234 RepID=A0ABD5NDM8_9EURY|nr:MATE family efflux transporter [Halobacterium litoreum]UHH13872.1 MATE family efflux transporter [Halobacterium litoreum]